MSQKNTEKLGKKLKEARYNFEGTRLVIKKKEEAVKLLIDSFFNPDFVCKQLGMHRRSFQRWTQKDPEFERACFEIKEGLKDEAEILLQKRMRNDDTTAIVFYLKTQCKGRGYVEKSEIEHSGSIPMTINLIEKPVEEIKHEKGSQPDNKSEAKGNAESPGR
jgi:hypothetical protein